MQVILLDGNDGLERCSPELLRFSLESLAFNLQINRSFVYVLNAPEETCRVLEEGAPGRVRPLRAPPVSRGGCGGLLQDVLQAHEYLQGFLLLLRPYQVYHPSFLETFRAATWEFGEACCWVCSAWRGKATGKPRGDFPGFPVHAPSSRSHSQRYPENPGAICGLRRSLMSWIPRSCRTWGRLFSSVLPRVTRTGAPIVQLALGMDQGRCGCTASRRTELARLPLSFSTGRTGYVSKEKMHRL